MEEWRDLYAPVFDKAFHDLRRNLYVNHVYLENEDLLQQMELVFASCFRDFENGINEDRLFPPPPAYFWRRVLEECKNMIYGNPCKAVGFSNLDPDTVEMLLAEKSCGWPSWYPMISGESNDPFDGPEDTMDELDFYLNGVAIGILATVYGCCRKFMTTRINDMINGLAVVLGVSPEALREECLRCHIEHRRSARIKLREIGIDMKPCRYYGDRDLKEQ